MRKLELLIPPPVINGLCALGMWGAGKVIRLEMNLPGGVWPAAALAIAALTLFLLAGRHMFRVKTTVSPFAPERSSTLINDGVFRYTRNPMYLAALLLLIAWGLFLDNLWAFVFPVLFFLYITRFQILPEEKILEKNFGKAYEAYKLKTRRWL